VLHFVHREAKEEVQEEDLKYIPARDLTDREKGKVKGGMKKNAQMGS